MPDASSGSHGPELNEGDWYIEQDGVVLGRGATPELAGEDVGNEIDWAKAVLHKVGPAGSLIFSMPIHREPTQEELDYALTLPKVGS